MNADALLRFVELTMGLIESEKCVISRENLMGENDGKKDVIGDRTESSESINTILFSFHQITNLSRPAKNEIGPSF